MVDASKTDRPKDNAFPGIGYVEQSFLRGLEQAQRGEFVATDFLDRLIEELGDGNLPVRD